MRTTMIAIAAALTMIAGAAAAQSPAQKAAVDAAKIAGTVGEQGDGFLGLVTPGDADLTAAVAEINARRADLYRDTAAKTGVTVEAAGQATARQLYGRIASGQWYKPLGGDWTRKP
jgi:uncharacterized protein YdbL (DUF1318 family)